MLGLQNCPFSVEKLIERFEETLKIQQASSAKYFEKIDSALSRLEQPNEELLKKHEMALKLKQENIVKAIQKFKQYLSENFTKLPLEFDYPKLGRFIKQCLASSDETEFLNLLQQIKHNLVDYRDWQPNEQVLNHHFQVLNDHYQYFQRHLSNLAEIFAKLSNTLRFLVKNLDYQHHYRSEKVFYEAAYKLMALFIDQDQILQSFNILCERMDEVFKARSMHDALLTDIKTLPCKKDSKRFLHWQSLFHQKKGFWYAIKCFSQNAVNIENLISADKELDLASIKNLELQLLYPNMSKQDKEFAELCRNYDVSPETFSQCIELIDEGWPKKTSDNLPDLIISDEQNEYFWVKMPVDDKCALILGHITECCQSIGGDSQACVIDGITRPNNGFYVLLKRIKSGNSAPFISLNPPQINYKDFQIIAQSYAWMSINGNLVLDSFEAKEHVLTYFENIKQRDYADKIKKLLDKFAKQVLIHHSSIKRVNLGLGGKTPNNLFRNYETGERPTSIISETMSEGYEYGDAQKQYRIASCLELNKQQQQKLLNLVLSQKGKINDLEFRQIAIIKYLLENVKDLDISIEKLQQLYQLFPDFKQLLSVDKLPRLIQMYFEFDWDILIPIKPEELKQGIINPLQLAWHLSNISIDNWPAYLKECTPDTIKMLSNWRDEKGRSLLSYASVSIEVFKLFLAQLTLEEKFKVALETDIIQTICHLHPLQLLFQGLSPAQQFFILSQTNKKSENALFNLIEVPDIVVKLLQKLTIEQKISLISQINSTGQSILLDPKLSYELLMVLLEGLNSEQKFALLVEKNLNLVDGLSSIINKPEHIFELFKGLNAEQQFKLLAKTNQDSENALFALKDCSEILAHIWQDLTASHKQTLLSHLNVNEYSILFEPHLKPATLKILLNGISVEQKYNLLMEKTLDLAETFCWIIQHPKYTRQDLYKYLKENFPNHCPEDISPRIQALFEGLSAKQTFEVLAKCNTCDENTIFALMAVPEVLDIIWRDLTINQKLQLIGQLDHLGMSILFHPNAEHSAMQIVLKNITAEQKFELLMAPDLNLTTVLITMVEESDHLSKEMQQQIDEDKTNRLLELFNGLTANQKFEILQRAEIFDFQFYNLLLKSDALFNAFFAELNMQQRLTLIIKIKGLLISVSPFPDKIHFLLAGFTPEQIHQLATANIDDGNYPYFYLLSLYPEALTAIFANISPDEKFAILITQNKIKPYPSLLEFTKGCHESLNILLKDLSTQQVKILAEEKNSEGKNVLEMLKPDSIESQIILGSMLSKHSLFAQDPGHFQIELNSLKK